MSDQTLELVKTIVADMTPEVRQTLMQALGVTTAGNEAQETVKTVKKVARKGNRESKKDDRPAQ